MALTLTTRITSKSSDNFGTGPYTSGSFTPSNSCLLCVIATGTSNVAGDPKMTGSKLTITDSAGLTWTSRAATSTAPTWAYGMRAWTAPVTTGSSMTVTVDCDNEEIFSYGLVAFDVTGYDTGTPVSGDVVGTDADGNGVGALTLAATPATADLAIAAATVQTGGAGAITVGTGWTEVYETGETDWWRFQIQSRTGSTSTGVQWDDLSTSGTPYDAVMLAFIIKNAGGGGASPVDPGVILPPPPAAFGPDRGFGFGY